MIADAVAGKERIVDLGRDELTGYVRNTLDELRGESFRNLLYLTVFGEILWHIWVGTRMVTQNAPDKGLLIVPLLVLQALVLLLLSEHIRWAAALYLASSFAFVTMEMWLFGDYGAVFLYDLFTLVAVIVSGPWAGLLVALASTGAGFLLSASGGPQAASSLPAPLVGVSSFVTLIVSCILSHSLRTAVLWSLSSHQQMCEKLQETRKRRAQVIQLNQELERSRERLEHANGALLTAWRVAEEAERQQKRMTAFISHELRTPLNLIIGFSEMLVTSPKIYGLSQLPSKARRDLEALYRSAQQVSALVDDVLDMASADQGHLSLMREPSDLQQVLDRAVAMVQDYVEAKGLEISCFGEGELPPIVMDRLRIRQVILNLLVNAARFTEEGSIVVRAGLASDHVRIVVEDTGKGIPEERQTHLFDAFQAADARDSVWGKSTGLGLPLSRKLVQLHGGEMGVESVVGEGSAFWFTLPLDGDDGQASRPSLSHPTSQGDGNGGKPCVVAVAESEFTLRRLQRRLEAYRIIGAESAQEARRRAEELHALAILADKSLGVPESPEVVPIIECPLPSTRRRAGELGAELYLPKPVEKGALLQALVQISPRAGSVLVVDDDKRFVEMIVRFLESSGGNYQVQVAYDGAEALVKLREVMPDVVLLDLALPEMDGRQVLREKAKDSKTADIPVIVVSAPSVEEEMAPAEGTFSVYLGPGLHNGQVTQLLSAALDALSSPMRNLDPNAPGHL